MKFDQVTPCRKIAWQQFKSLEQESKCNHIKPKKNNGFDPTTKKWNEIQTGQWTANAQNKEILNKEFFFSKEQWVRVNCSNCICSNLDCSTLLSKMSTARHNKCQLLDRQKYAVHVPHFVFEQMIKKVQLLKILSSWKNFCDSKK